MIRWTLLPFAMAGALALSLPAPATAAIPMASEGAQHQSIYVARDKSASFRLERPASRIVVGQPEIAKVTATSNSSFFVQGIELGSTNMLVYGPDGRLQEVLDIRVGYDANGLQQDLTAAFPEEPIRVRNLGESVMLEGEVSHTGIQTKAEAIAYRYAPDSVISRLTTRASQQVVLEVRVLEANRTALQDLGVRGTTGGTNVSFDFGRGLLGQDPASGVLRVLGGGMSPVDVQLQAMEQKGIVRTLARPNLVALPGQTATFHAGGEYPYPVPQKDNQITIEFRTYGVELAFTPTVQDNGLIRMDVAPRVSQLDFQNSIRILGLNVPALIARETKTTVELRPGESLTIGGLFQREYSNTVNQVPGLGNVPVLGALFRSNRWKQAETELLVIVTPRYVEPADMQKAAATKTMPGEEPKRVDTLLNGKVLDRALSGPEGHE